MTRGYEPGFRVRDVEVLLVGVEAVRSTERIPPGDEGALLVKNLNAVVEAKSRCDDTVARVGYAVPKVLRKAAKYWRIRGNCDEASAS